MSVKLCALSRATRKRSANGSSRAAALWRLVEPTALANMKLTIDAEEADRLEFSLDCSTRWPGVS